MITKVHIIQGTNFCQKLITYINKSKINLKRKLCRLSSVLIFIKNNIIIHNTTNISSILFYFFKYIHGRVCVANWLQCL